MTSGTNFRVTRSLNYTATKPRTEGKPNHINEDVVTLSISDGFLKYAAVFDGAGGSGQGSTKSGKTQAYMAANFLATKASAFLDFSNISPLKMPQQIQDKENVLKQIFQELVQAEALPDQSTGVKVSGDPANKRFPTTLAAVVSDSDGGLYSIFQGDSQIFGIFEKRIIPLSLISTYKLSPSQNKLCFIDVSKLQKENEKTLGTLKGVIICSDGFLENNTAFGYPYDDVIYTNLQTIYNITLNENTDYSKGQLKRFLDGFVGDDDKSMISLVFEPTEVLKEPFYVNHRVVNFKNQMQLSDELVMKQRLLVLSTATPGSPLSPSKSSTDKGVLQSDLRYELVKKLSEGARIPDFSEKVSLEYFYAESQKKDSQQDLLTLETLMMVLASKDESKKNEGLAEMLEAINSAKMFFDTTHLVGTPLGLLSSDTCFKAKDYENLRTSRDQDLSPIEMGADMLGHTDFLTLAQSAYLSVPTELRNDFGCVYLEMNAGEASSSNKEKGFTLDTTSFDYVCLVLRQRELNVFKKILEKIPYPEIKKFRIFTINDPSEKTVVQELEVLQGLDKNIMVSDAELKAGTRSPGAQFLDFIKKLVVGNKTSTTIQNLNEHKRIFEGDTQAPLDDGGQQSLF